MKGIVRGGRNDGSVLTGNAVVADVANGKTFYNTDALTKLTGTSTAKQYATGSKTTDMYTTGGNYFCQVRVTGLAFRPRIVYAVNTAGGQYQGSACFVSGKEVGYCYDYDAGSTIVLQSITHDNASYYTGASDQSDGFNLCVRMQASSISDTTVTWYAFE